MKYKITTLIFFLFSSIMSNNAQDIYIQGGGTLADWAHLKKFEKQNEKLKRIDESNRVVFMGNSITEGIGTGRITKNFDKALVDEAFQTNDIEALNLIYDLIEKQKIVLGGSSGINIAGAIKLAKQMGPGKTSVTILCDHGKRYASKIFNKEFLKSTNLPIPTWL